MTPPAIQAPRIRAGVCTCRATTYGLMKIPDPMIPPMTIIVASNAPSRRASVVMRAPMVVHAYHFSMHRLLAVLTLAALPLSAATYEARSPHHSVVLESTGTGEYAIRVTDRKSTRL